jgi:hypothetical protein
MSRLLHQLYNWFLFAGTMFFAAGASGFSDAGAGGGGGEGSEGGAAGSGDSGDPGADPGAGEGGEDASAGDGAAGDDRRAADGGDRDRDLDAPVDLGDGRTVPAKWKNVFEAAKGQGLEKEVKQLFFANQRLTQKFPGGVNEALTLANQLEEVGGFEAIQEMQSDLETYHADAETFAKDPAKWIETSFAEDVDASLKAFAASLDYVSDKHPEHYNHLLGKVVANTLDQGPVHEIYSLLASLKDNPAAQKLAKDLARYYNGIKELAAKVPEKKVEPERAKLEADRQKLASEQEQLRNHTVNSQTIPLLGRQMTTQIEKLAKDAGFDVKKFIAEQPEAAQSLRAKILNQVMAKAAADKVFVKNYKAVMNQGDTQRAIAMMNKQHQAILPDIVRDVAKGFGIAKKGGTAARTNAGGNAGSTSRASGGNSGGMTRVSAKPPANEIDWGKTGNRIYDSEAVLKNGKVVTWA